MSVAQLMKQELDSKPLQNDRLRRIELLTKWTDLAEKLVKLNHVKEANQQLTDFVAATHDPLVAAKPSREAQTCFIHVPARSAATPTVDGKRGTAPQQPGSSASPR